MDEGGIDFEALAVETLTTDANLISTVLDKDMIVRWVSPSAANYGLEPVGRSVIELVHADDLDRVATTFDMTAGPDDYQSSRLTNVVIPLRLVTPLGLVPVEATGRWVKAAADWYFVVSILDVTARFGITEALRVLAGDLDETLAVQTLVDACRSFDGIDGAQLLWNSVPEEIETMGDLGAGREVLLGAGSPRFSCSAPDADRSTLLDRETTSLPAAGLGLNVPGYDWGHVFPVPSGSGRLGAFAFWGHGPQPEVRFLGTVVTPLLDLAALALTRLRSDRALEARAVTDPVTGVLNRRGFLDQFAEADDEWVAVMYVDLDDFKQVNDTWGHAVGDKVLAIVGERLRHVVSRRDVVARIGGDEFAVSCRNVQPELADVIAHRVLEALNHPFDVGGIIVPGGASIGVVVGTNRSTGAELLDRADRALMLAKARGKGRLVVGAGEPGT